MDHGVRISEILAEAYGQHCCVANFADSYVREKAIQLGFSLGLFPNLCVYLTIPHSRFDKKESRSAYGTADSSLCRIVVLYSLIFCANFILI